MTASPDNIDKANELRSKGMHAVRAGQTEAARIAFLKSLAHDPNNATTYLWLAGVAPTEREAYRFLNQARELDPDHPQLERAVQGIHQHFSQQKAPPAPKSQEEAVSQAEPVVYRRSKRWAEGWFSGLAGTALAIGWRVLSIIVLLVTIIFLVALLVELGRKGDLTSFPQALPAAADFTWEYVQGVARGDLGEIASALGTNRGRPVTMELARALPKSLFLLAVSLLIAVPIGIYLGLGAALRRHSRLSGLIIFASTFGLSTPSYFAAMLLIWFLVWIYKSTGNHVLPIAGFGWDTHVILPALVLAARPAAAVTRLSYNALIEILDADYVRTAKGKGLKQRAVLTNHVLRNAGVPILTTVVVSLRFSLAVLPIVEYIFSWPGVGQGLLVAIQAQNIPAVLGMAIPLALVFVGVNVLVDWLYGRLDPRLRTGKAGVA